eukprot:5616779-Lingulodinium_polyedra.AAC.1
MWHNERTPNVSAPLGIERLAEVNRLNPLILEDWHVRAHAIVEEMKDTGVGSCDVLIDAMKRFCP